MKVMCIDEKDYAPQANLDKLNVPIRFGDILEVERETIGYDLDGKYATPCYKFFGINDGVYDKRNLAPISEIDEAELSKQRQTEYA